MFVDSSEPEQSHRQRKPIVEKGTAYVALDDGKRKIIAAILPPGHV